MVLGQQGVGVCWRHSGPRVLVISVFPEGQTRLSEQGLGREEPWQRGDRGFQAPWVHSLKNLSVHAVLAERGVRGGQELAGCQGGC